MRQRALGGKQSLAIREFALGVESLERFVRNEPLRRVHECVFGVLKDEIDFSGGIEGLHHIPPGSKVFFPASIGQSVGQYFSRKAEERGIDLSDILTEVLPRDIEIREALK